MMNWLFDIWNWLRFLNELSKLYQSIKLNEFKNKKGERKRKKKKKKGREKEGEWKKEGKEKL